MKLTDEVLRKAVEELDAAILAQLDREMAEAPHRPSKTAEQSWEEFLRYYLNDEPPEAFIDVTGTPLTPSFHGKDCLGNGEHDGIECCCDECDWCLACFPEYA